jgi:cyclopropane fatty-acyl-phospholipid synthase-like methyltransferase
MDMVLDHVPESTTLFDLGCGTGAFLQIAVESKAPTRIGGCEISPVLLEKTRSRLLTQAPRVTDANDFLISQAPPENIKNFDTITLVDVLHHIPKQNQHDFFARIHAHMRSDAIFLLKDIDAASPLVCFNKLHDAVFAGNGFQERAASDVVKELKNIGFQVLHQEKRRRLWYPHYLIVACKA